MTNSDDLLQRLEQAADLLEMWGPRCGDYEPECPVCQQWREHDEVVNRIRKLEAYTDTFSPDDVLGVREGTHVIVPVEPSEAALDAISDEIAGSGWMPSDETLRAIYRAAQVKQDAQS